MRELTREQKLEQLKTEMRVQYKNKTREEFSLDDKDLEESFLSTMAEALLSTAENFEALCKNMGADGDTLRALGLESFKRNSK